MLKGVKDNMFFVDYRNKFDLFESLVGTNCFGYTQTYAHPPPLPYSGDSNLLMHLPASRKNKNDRWLLFESYEQMK